LDTALGPQQIVGGKDLAAKSSEVDFAIVLSRVIASMEKDPAQLRSAVYELARIKLQAELPINISEKPDLALALEPRSSVLKLSPRSMITQESGHRSPRSGREVPRLNEDLGRPQPRDCAA
jgi:hypothetical protein